MKVDKRIPRINGGVGTGLTSFLHQGFFFHIYLKSTLKKYNENFLLCSLVVVVSLFPPRYCCGGRAPAGQVGLFIYSQQRRRIHMWDGSGVLNSNHLLLYCSKCV